MLKKLLFFSMLSLPVWLSAQQSKVVSAFNYLNNYNKEKNPDDLRSARQNIDEAILNENTVGKAKTWYYRGNVYMAVFTSELRKEIPDALKLAAEAYAKVSELDPRYENAEESFKLALMCYKNQGVISFNEGNFVEALSSFEKVIELSTNGGAADKDAVENAAVSAMRSKDYNKSIQYYRQIISFNTDTSGKQYLQLYKAYLANADTAGGMSALKEGRSKFPKNNDLLIEELKYHLANNQNAEAEKLLNEAIAADPLNYTLYLAAGSTYEKQNKRKEALDAYLKAIELKPEAWEAYYNIGANYNNEGRRLQELANNEKDTKKYDAGIKLADEELKKALENLEKAKLYVPAGNDRRDVLVALKQLYGRLNMTDKYNEVKKELEGK